MCLITIQKRAKTAKENITCYKVIKNRNTHLISPFQDYRWYVGKLETIDKFEILESVVYKGLKDIDKGLHAYKSFDLTIKRLYYFTHIPEKLQIHECIIPKGSKYYENGTEIVSNQMILGKRVWKNF